MSASFFDAQSVSPAQARSSAASGKLRTSVLRALLVAGCAIAVAISLAIGNPAELLAADPELSLLLRGMALIKAILVAGGLSALWWRFRWPVSTKLALGYVAGAWLVTGATMMIWQLTAIAAAAVAFHVGEVTLLVLAWRDYRDDASPPT
jgi:hypothetical protein